MPATRGKRVSIVAGLSSFDNFRTLVPFPTVGFVAQCPPERLQRLSPFRLKYEAYVPISLWCLPHQCYAGVVAFKLEADSHDAITFAGNPRVEKSLKERTKPGQSIVGPQ